MRLIRPARPIELGMRSHRNETRASSGQPTSSYRAGPSSDRHGFSVRTATYSELSRAEPGLE